MKSLTAAVILFALIAGPACVPGTQVAGSLPSGQPVPDVPAAPAHLLLTGRGQAPPLYTLRWVAPAGVTVDHFNVYRSTSPITEENRAASLLIATTAPSLIVQIDAGSGIQYFRVSAVDAGGAETPLSTELQLDTTPRAIYRADALQDNVFELFMIPLTGGAPLRVSGVLVAGRSVNQFAWSPDGRKIAFLADLDIAGRRELYVAAADGTSPPLKVSGPTIFWAQVTAFAWAPDGQRIAFITDRLNDGVFDLYVADVVNRTPQLVSSIVPRRGGYDGVRSFAWSADATRLAFVADSITDDLFELFVVNPDTPNALRVSGAFARLGDPLDGVSEFAWAPDGSRLAYVANATFAGMHELFSVPASGGTVINISGPLVAGGSVSDATWSPDSTRLAYLADKSVPGAVGLWVAAGDGSTGSLLASGLTLPDTAVSEYAWSRDGTLLGFRGDVEVPGIPALYVVNPGGTVRLRVSGVLVASSSVAPDWAWSPDSRRLAFRGSLGIAPNVELFTTRADATSLLNAVPELLLDRNINAFAWSADGTREIYASNLELKDQIALYLAAANPQTGISTHISGFLPTFGNVTVAATSPLSSEDVPISAAGD